LRFLITGSTGFVGRHLTALLQSEGHEVAGLGLGSGADYAVDVRDREAVVAAASDCRPDGVFHLAAIAFVPAANADPVAADAVNHAGTANVLDAAAAAGARVLVVSTGAVYGTLDPSRLPADEATELRPQDAYAASKAAAEHACIERAGRQEIIRVRPFNHAGPGQAPQYVCSDFASQIAECEAGRRAARIEVGDLSAERDFTDVRDVVRAYLLAWERGLAGEVYNVCSGRAIAISWILDTLVSMARIDVVVEVRAERLRASDVSRAYGSFAKLEAATGWRPRIPLERTLTDVLDDWRRRVARTSGA
jgi:GDP-4-dehydro-6-deoxy-D-mannose reductase